MLVNIYWASLGILFWCNLRTFRMKPLITNNYVSPFVPPALTFRNSTFCPRSVFVCSIWISEQLFPYTIISLYRINWLVCINQVQCVYCAVRAWIFKYSRTPLIRTLVIRIANYPYRLGPSGKFVQNSTKLTCLEITGYRIKYSRVLWLLELQIRCGRKGQTQVHTVNSDGRTSNINAADLKKNPIILIFCLSGCLGVPFNSDKWSSAV